MALPARDRELVQIMDARLAETARRSGPWLVCRLGCTQCCHGAFAINALDAERLRTGMGTIRQSDPALFAEIQRRAQAWVAEHGPTFPGNRKTGILGGSDSELERFDHFANDAACPALDPATGRCDVYTWRPMACRVFGPPVRMGEGEAFACCELCFVGASKDEIAACELLVPYDLEDRIISEVKPEPGYSGDTVVAFALLRPPPDTTR